MRPGTDNLGAAPIEQQAARKRGSRGGRRRGKRNTAARRLHAEARELTQRTTEARKDRRASWPEGGQDVFATERQEIALDRLYGEKRVLRRDVRDAARLPEGSPYSGQVRP